MEGSPRGIVIWTDEPGKSREICKITARPEAEAYGKLIAAAPDLLAELRRSQKALECADALITDAKTIRSVKWTAYRTTIRQAIESGRAMLAKAKVEA